jgi:hypothetical protein
VGTFQRVADARLHVWRCSPTVLNVGEALVVMTVDDAQRMRLDDHTTTLAYMSSRFGPGSYRLTPRTDQGTYWSGTQSLVAIIDEDSAIQVTMQSPSLTASPMPQSLPMDSDTVIEIERIRLQAELERERETRREGQREIREERWREREVER